MNACTAMLSCCEMKHEHNWVLQKCVSYLFLLRFSASGFFPSSFSCSPSHRSYVLVSFAWIEHCLTAFSSLFYYHWFGVCIFSEMCSLVETVKRTRTAAHNNQCTSLVSMLILTIYRYHNDHLAFFMCVVVVFIALCYEYYVVVLFWHHFFAFDLNEFVFVSIFVLFFIRHLFDPK